LPLQPILKDWKIALIAILSFFGFLFPLNTVPVFILVAVIALLLYNFGGTTFGDIPSVIFTAGSFIAFLKKIDLSYILLVGAILSILLFGLLL